MFRVKCLLLLQCIAYAHVVCLIMLDTNNMLLPFTLFLLYTVLNFENVITTKYLLETSLTISFFVSPPPDSLYVKKGSEVLGK